MPDHRGRRVAALRGGFLSRAPLLGRDAYRAWTSITRRWGDADRYRHVNNTVHYRWFDDAVNGWLIANGLLELDGDGPIGLVVETGCRYAAPLDFPGTVEVGLLAEHVGTSSVRYRLGVFGDGQAEAAAEGHFVHVYVDRASRRPQSLHRGFRDAVRRIGPSPGGR